MGTAGHWMMGGAWIVVKDECAEQRNIKT